MSVIRIGLAVFCILLCICAFLLPERSAFSFNLDYLEYINKNHQFLSGTNDLSNKKTYTMVECMGIGNVLEEIMDEADKHHHHHHHHHVENRYVTACNYPSGTLIDPNIGIDLLKSVEDCESKMLANTLIKKINCENHCKNGKLNPLYEEDHQQATNQPPFSISTIDNQNTLTSVTTLNLTPPKSSNNLQKIFNSNETSTKF